MPFFRPLNFKELPPKEEICEVSKTMKGADSQSLYYKDDDVRWRHFGRMYGSEVVAFDFNNMEIIDSNDDPDTKIENQVGNLFESIEK